MTDTQHPTEEAAIAPAANAQTNPWVTLSAEGGINKFKQGKKYDGEEDEIAIDVAIKLGTATRDNVDIGQIKRQMVIATIDGDTVNRMIPSLIAKCIRGANGQDDDILPGMVIPITAQEAPKEGKKVITRKQPPKTMQVSVLSCLDALACMGSLDVNIAIHRSLTCALCTDA